MESTGKADGGRRASGGFAKKYRVLRDLLPAFSFWKAGGAEGIRTPDPHNAIVVLYQLSYDPSPNNAA